MAHPPHHRAETDISTYAASVPCAPTDLRAAEALAEAMASWDANELGCYREAVAAEIARLGSTPPDGFLAAEILALAWLEGAVDVVQVRGAA